MEEGGERECVEHRVMGHVCMEAGLQDCVRVRT